MKSVDPMRTLFKLYCVTNSNKLSSFQTVLTNTTFMRMQLSF